VPGGFADGDYLGSAKVLANKLRFKLGTDIKRFIAEEKLALGICNGFQAIVKAGILPGFKGNYAEQLCTLSLNDSGHFQDQWVELPAKTIAMNTYEAVSLTMWYTPKAGANTGYTMLAYFGDSVNGLGSNGYFFSPARGDNVSRTAISVGNVSAPWSAESGANGPEYDDGKPHFVVSTMDATTIKLYVDGVLTASTALSATNKISGISQNLAYLAKGGYTGDPEWIGSLQEFRIYNKALTAGEVRNLAGQR
jgi:hypothetical protein